MNVNVDLMEENVIHINGGKVIDVDVSVKSFMYVKNHYVWNPAACNCENGKYLTSIMNDSVIICDKFIVLYAKPSPEDDDDDDDQETKTNFNEEKSASKTQNFYILFAFLLIIIALLIPVSIYCYLIKYQPKQKHLLQYHDTTLKQVSMNNVN